MAVETLTLTLSEAEKVKGSDLISGDEDDNQIVTVEDGGELTENGFLLFEFWGKDSPTEAGAGPGGDDFFMFDLSTFDDTFDIFVKSMDDGDVFQFSGWDTWTPPDPGDTVHTFTYTGTDGGSYTVTIDAQSANGDDGVDVVQVICFGRGTLIDTPDGPRAVETLQADDLVLCEDGVARPIVWVGSRLVDRAEIRDFPHLRPVEFAPGSLGALGPSSPLLLSPHHKVLVEGAEAELLFGEPRMLVPAYQLINGDSIRQRPDLPEIEYFHVLLDGHHVVRANGLACESLMPAEHTFGVLGAKARAEILAKLPQLAQDLATFGPVAYPQSRGKDIGAFGKAA